MADMNLKLKRAKGLTDTTNILDIKVPTALRNRHKCGISWIDQAYGGEGFVPSSVHMLTGMPGTGKSTMVRQLADAITGQGHICLYNTGEENLYQVKMCTERMGLKNGFYVASHTLVKDLLAHADKLRKLNPGKQVFLLHDSLQTLDDGFYANGTTNSVTPVRCCEKLTEWAKETYSVVMFIGQSTKNGDFSGKNTIKHLVDGHANLYFDEEKKSETYGERLFEVTKNRYGCSGKTFIIGMGDKGLYEKGSYVKGA